MPLPAAPASRIAVPGPRKAVKAHRRKQFEKTPLAHEVEPSWIERAGAAQDRLPAPVTHPVSGTGNHLAEQEVVGIGAPVPVEQIVGLVPELDFGEMLAIAGEHMIDEIGIILEHTWRAGGLAGARERGRGIVDAWEDIELAGELGQQPVIPLLPAFAVVFGPGKVRAQMGGAGMG